MARRPTNGLLPFRDNGNTGHRRIVGTKRMPRNPTAYCMTQAQADEGLRAHRGVIYEMGNWKKGMAVSVFEIDFIQHVLVGAHLLWENISNALHLSLSFFGTCVRRR